MSVNEMEVEYDYYLTLAKLFDEGYPSIPHAHCVSVPPSLSDGISEKSDTKPEECATDDAPSWEEKRKI